MTVEIIKIAGQIAGIGGIALGIFLILYRDIIQKKIFPTLTKQQGFQLLVLISILVWSMGLAGIGAWIWTHQQTLSSTDKHIPQQIEISGTNLIQTGAEKEGVGVVQTGSGIIHIGISLEQYEAGLRRREIEAEARLKTAHANDRQLLETELKAIHSRLLDAQRSYEQHVEDLRQRITQLESIRGQVTDELLKQAQQALARGDYKNADQLFQQVEKDNQKAIVAVAEANFQRCQIAEDEIKYREAYSLCQKAVQLIPERFDYLYKLADLAGILGFYEQAKNGYEQVLANHIKTYGEDHPETAIRRNDLGTAWHDLGNYHKAIVFYEQALASDLKTYGENHHKVALRRNNLGSAWQALGEYKKAISYFEQALSSDLKTYGDDHPDVAIDLNNLGLAWMGFKEYPKAINYLEQALESDLKSFGPDHPKVAIRCNNLASAWQKLGDKDKAIGYYKQALNTFKKSLGNNHLFTIKTQNNLERLENQS